MQQSGDGMRVRSVSPPVPLLLLSLLCVVASILLAFAHGSASHAAGYLLGSIVAIALVAVFHRVDLERRQSPYYVPRRIPTRYAGVLVAAGLAIASLHAWWLATELAR